MRDREREGVGVQLVGLMREGVTGLLCKWLI